MSEHRAQVHWERGDHDFAYDAYSRDHNWTFPGGERVAASAAPDFLGSPERVDPEESFVAAVSSCHMLTFLAIAARKRIVVERYVDAAVGFMEENDRGRLAITRVILRPDIRFGAGSEPTPAQIEKMHHQAHDHCFIANSVSADVRVEAPQES